MMSMADGKTGAIQPGPRDVAVMIRRNAATALLAMKAGCYRSKPGHRWYGLEDDGALEIARTFAAVLLLSAFINAPYCWR